MYAIFCDSEHSYNYTIMEYTHGETLASAWSSLNHTQKVHNCDYTQKLRGRLRALPSSGYFGSICRSHLLDSMFWTQPYIQVAARIKAFLILTEDEILKRSLLAQMRYSENLNEQDRKLSLQTIPKQLAYALKSRMYNFFFSRRPKLKDRRHKTMLLLRE